jgi:hypothetical protein
MKSIDIFVDGKYDYKFQLGTWIYYMSYKTAVIKRTGTYIGYGSQVRSTLCSLYMALGKIKEPCYINIYSKVPLGFRQPKKSANKDLLVNIQTAVNKAGHILNIEIDKEFSKPTMWEQVYGKPISKQKVERTVKPSIENKKTPNEVFSKTESEQDRLKREWEELLNDNHGAWVPGSGGY